jgi:hypothetical protein
LKAILVTLDNKRLGLVLETHALIAQMAFDGKWRSCAAKNIHLVSILANTLSVSAIFFTIIRTKFQPKITDKLLIFT